MILKTEKQPDSTWLLAKWQWTQQSKRKFAKSNMKWLDEESNDSQSQEQSNGCQQMFFFIICFLGQCCDEWQAGNGNMSSVGCCFLSNTQVCWLSSLRHCFGFSSSSNWCLGLSLLIFCILLLIGQLSRSQTDMFWQDFLWQVVCCSVFQKMAFTQRMDCFGAAWWASGRHDSPRLWKFCSHWAGHCKFDAFIEKSLKMDGMCKEKKTPSFTMWANKQHKNSNRIKAFWCLDILVSSRSQHSVTTQVLVEKHQFGSNIMVVKRVTMWIATLLLERNLLQIVLV